MPHNLSSYSEMRSDTGRLSVAYYPGPVPTHRVRSQPLTVVILLPHHARSQNLGAGFLKSTKVPVLSGQSQPFLMEE